MNDDQTQDTAIVELTFTQFMIDKFRDTMDLEIELLEGEHKLLPDDMHWYKIQVSGYKLEMIKDFMNMLMQTASDKIKVKYFGTTINPN